ncbi:FAD-binding and (Fe-S)-binding domain-containing protein [Herminiimonas glaciei]|uniref:FAD-binding and (Fe-S)-binding domain-containing protein n=1 Tax=Herminiimonas glaciei TaxID=523788 RepID=A0ABW2IFM9_9BURK
MLVKPIHFVPVSGSSPSPLASRLRKELRGDVLFSKADRGRYATDASIYQIMPIGVVVPRDQDDLLLCLDIARSEKTPILARGGGTSQCGQTVGEALVIDNSKWLNNVIEFDPIERTITVEPGIVLDHLNAWLKPHGLWFPVDVSTAAQCTIGGMAGNNSCGSRSIEYGNMVHNVLAIDAVLADGTQARFETLEKMAGNARLQEITQGLRRIATREQDEIIERVPKVLRRVGGYNIDLFDCQNPRAYTDDGSANLAHILVGSEGTLAFSRQLKLKLSPLPKHKVLGVINFPTFYQAMDSAQHIVKLLPTAVELVDSTMIKLSLNNPAFRPVIEKALVGTPEAILLVEFSGDDKAALVERLSALSDLMSDLSLPGSVVDMVDANEQKSLWDVRKAGLNIMMSMKGDGKPVSFIEDCAVPLVHLAEYTSRLTEVFHKYHTEGTWYAHASVGTLHVRPILDMRRNGAADMRQIAEEASALVREYKGAYSGEHGDGLCRGEWVSWQYGPKINQAFSEIKDLFDPDNRFNPDKIVRPPKMDEKSNFRFAPGYRELPLKTQMDWSAWDVTRDPASGVETAPGTGDDRTGGLAKAVEMCNNNGHCRKFDADTMCPSYRITKDERHVTRGRANTLRLAISGQLGDDGLASAEVKEVLDLCVSCKGCKRDCPTGVDMAKVKIEARAAWANRHGSTLREKMVAFMPRYAPYASRIGGLLAIGDKLPFVSGWLKKSLGLAPQRAFPRFRTSFLSQLGTGSKSTSGNKEVLLFVDTFNNYMEPENARAAQAVLEAAGYTVHFNVKEGERPLCCGRTYLSAGLVDEAKQEARRTLDALMPYINRGVAIVGLEPSCLLSLRDEFLSYGYGEEAKKLASMAWLFEEFLVNEKTAGRLQLDLKPLPVNKAMVHGHCHQKAFNAVRPVQTVLQWIPQLDVALIESSCCGMAGSFGYEAEHYEASQAMGELKLFPAIRAAEENTLFVADGTSCRHQIADGTQENAMHVARVLADSLRIQ